jgi:HK97 family phage portal protein
MCIAKWGTEFPQVKFTLHNDKGEPQYNHAFARILSAPNPEMDWTEFQLISAMYRLLTGTTFVQVLRNKTGNMIGLMPRHAREIEKNIVSGTHVGYWHQSPTGQREPIKLEDMISIPWMFRSPQDIRVGVAPLESCWTQFGTYDSLDRFVFQFISNGAVPGVAIIAKDGIEGTDEDKDKLKQDLSHNYGLSGGNVGKAILLEGDFDVKQLSTTLKDLALDGLRDTPEANICGAFCVPPQLIGANVGIKSSIYSNMKEARRGFVENTLVPIWEYDASRLSLLLEREYGLSGWYLQPDTSRVAALKEDEALRNDRAVKNFQANLFSRDQALAYIGEEPVDGAPVYFIDLQRQTIPVGKSGLGVATKSAEEMDGLWKSLDDAKMDHVKQLSERLQKQAKVMIDEMLSSAKSGVGVKKKEPKIPSDEDLKRIFLEGTDKERKSLVASMIKRAAEDAGFNFGDVESWLDGVTQTAAGESAEKISESYGTIRKDLQNIVAASGDATFDELKAALDEYLEKFPGSAARIAQTTVTTTTSVAQQETWTKINKRREDKKEIEQMWLSERDGQVRPKHARRDGQIRKMGETFDGGSPGPGLSGVADDDINCRCVLTPVTVKKGK